VSRRDIAAGTHQSEGLHELGDVEFGHATALRVKSLTRQRLVRCAAASPA
jgi:hypothetical protein